MADDDRLLLAQRCDQRNHVADVVQDRVVVRVCRRLGLAKAAHVGSDRAEPCGRNSRKLMSPRIPELRPAVTHDHERASALLRYMHANTVDGQRVMLQFPGHELTYLRCGVWIFGRNAASTPSTGKYAQMR